MSYGRFLRCGLGALALSLLLAQSADARQDMTAAEAKALLDNPPAGLVLLDVRTPGEFAAGHIEGAVNMNSLEPDFLKRAAKLPPEAPLLIYCRSGNRSSSIIERMEKAGIKNEIYHLEHGINDWNAAGLPLTR